MSDWDLVFDDVNGREIRLGPWPRWQCDRLAKSHNQWQRTLGGSEWADVVPHKRKPPVSAVERMEDVT